MSKIANFEQQDSLHSLYTLTLILYILQALALITAIPMIIVVVINYIKLDDVRNSWLMSHFRWQLRTFWFGLLFYIIAIITHFILIGFIIGGVTWLWQAYRVIRGWLNLIEHQEVYR